METALKENNPAPINVLNFKVDSQTLLALTRKLYQDNFFVIWAREVIQNSVDAKATYVKIRNEYGTEDCNRTRIIVEDDGIGMNENIIINAFLALGESIKPEDLETVGGFGVAKAIVLNGTYKGKSPYSVEEVYWYVITTYNVEGELKSFYLDSEMLGKKPLMEIEPLKKTGTKVVVYRKERAYQASDSYFRQVMENCNVNSKLFYNEIEMKQLKRARKKYSTEWCEVYYKKDSLTHQKNYAIVRINGVYQFRIYVSNKMLGTSVVEIKTSYKPSDEGYPLTPNREQIKEDYRQALDEILDNFKSSEVNQEEKDEFTFEVWNNPNYENFSYNNDFFQEEEINHYNREEANELKMIEKKKKEIENQIEQADNEEKEIFSELLSYEIEREKEAQKRLEEAIQKEKQQKLTKSIENYWRELRNSVIEEDSLNIKIDKFEEVFNVNLPSIAIKTDKKSKQNIDLFNKKNLKVLYCAKVFADLIFKLAKDKIYKYDYTIGWTVGSPRAEYIQKDGETYILVNPKGLKISKIKTFTANLTERLVHEILHRRHSWHDEAMFIDFHAIKEECVNENIELFEKIARKILKS